MSKLLILLLLIILNSCISSSYSSIKVGQDQLIKAQGAAPAVYVLDLTPSTSLTIQSPQVEPLYSGTSKSTMGAPFWGASPGIARYEFDPFIGIEIHSQKHVRIVWENITLTNLEQQSTCP